MLKRKLLFSLLLATVVFASFAVVAYSGLFDLIDTRLYDQRVRSRAAERLDSIVTEVEDYRREIVQALAELVDRRSMRTVFRTNQSLTDVQDRQAALAAFAEQHPEFDFIRFVDNARSQLWFSSRAADIAVRRVGQVTYQPVASLDPALDLPTADREGLRWFGPRGAFQISVQVLETNDAPQGLALAWFRLSDLTRQLVDGGWIGPSEQVQLADDGTLIVNARRHFTTADREAIVAAFAQDEATALVRSELGQEFALVRRESRPDLPQVLLLVPSDRLRMDPVLRAILLAGSFVITFLLVFLLLNLRQDPAIVVAERFRRFQQAVVRDLLATDGPVDPELWRRELEARREKIDAQLRRGIGRLRGDRKAAVERRIARSWSEMYRVLGSSERSQTMQLEAVSLEQIQRIIEQTISRYGPGLAAKAAAAEGRSRSGPDPAKPAEVESLEPIDAEPADLEPVEAESLEPVDAEPAEVESLEPIDAEPADLEPVEVESLEPVDAEPADLEPVEVENLEPIDAEPAEVEAEDLESADADDLESADADDLEPTVVEDLEPTVLEPAVGDGESDAIPSGDSQELQPNVRAGASPAPRSLYRVRGLVDSDAFQLVDVDDFAALLMRHSRVIEERAGLPYIDSSAFGRKSPKIDLQTQTLADQIITHRNEASFDEVLYSRYGDLDLDDVLDTSDETDPPHSETPPNGLAIGYGGFDFGVASSDGSEHEVYRGLVRLTRRWSARLACILERQSDACWSVRFAIGMPQNCPDALKLGPDTELARNVFALKRVLLLKRPLAMFQDFDGSCHAEQLESIWSWLWVPLEHRESRYLLVGFAHAFEDLDDLSTRTQIVAEAV